MNSTTPVCVWPVEAVLGEGPVWRASEDAVYFVDIKQRKLHRLTTATGETRTWSAPAQIGFVAPYANETFVCGLQGGLHRFTPSSGQFELLKRIESELPGNRLNDGYADARGRLWFGSMDDAEVDPSGSLYMVDENGEIVVRDSGYVITNGPAMSPDGRTLYHGNTIERVVYAFDVASDGTLSGKRTFAAISGTGYPDGMAVDSEGFVWIALFGGARIERYSPAGALVEEIAFPCSNVTKLAFAGHDLRTVYATTARKGLSQEQLREQPLAGGLFSFRSPVPGQAQAVCTAALG
ncbi:SMP-30/gluconolactonase/LRE family protein [Paraburkholderia dinghuensis]|uniref:SMP-30/gluconolactonase/LRE family protein n=1 Tax=Paraburkholderia dinghuensis TaxID=2305225 RepID=A0A3N6NEL5_9BURK|nr:SMP-30/gluconolactonase/LRE family protein [Paraburkholderia dinghuensis]RQH07007.1 SMP-30/gluconolactonase/LRE family protein [Paraburkholderia dinghuensis]